MLQSIQLWYLVQINQYKSLSQAADALHVSQPAISNAIKRLETQLGVQLLERTSKGVTLTEKGEQVARKAREILLLMDELEEMYAKHKNTELLLNDIVLYANPAFSPFLLSSLSNYYKQEKSDHILQVRDIQPDMNLSKILSNSNKTVILSLLPKNYELPSYISAKVLGESLSYVTCKKNFSYISQEQTHISMNELIHVPLGITTASFEFQTILLNALKEYGNPNITIMAPNSSSLQSVVQNGSVASIGNKFTINSNNLDLRYIPIDNSPIFSLCLLYNNKTSPQIVQQLYDLLSPFML